MRKWFWRIYLILLLLIPLMACQKKCESLDDKMATLFIDKYGTCPKDVYAMHIVRKDGQVTATISCPGGINENTPQTIPNQNLRVLYGEPRGVL